jgi:hypothetical protein
MHKYWHFIDEPFSPDGTPLHNPDTPNAPTQIAAFRAKLSGPGVSSEDKDIKSYNLVWLLHLVGDVHQPLHTTSRFTRGLPNGDEGGNDVKIHCGSGCGAVELHGFWDDVLGTRVHPQDAIDAAKRLPDPDARLASIADERTWINESFEAAKAHAYVQPIGEGAGPFTLTDNYKSSALNLAEQRVVLAGARLANLLNIAEADAFVALWKDLKLPDGRARVVRHGHGPHRAVQTGVGPVEVRRAKVRDRGEVGTEAKIRFASSILPKWARRTKSLDALLPVLYLRGVSTGDFQEALAALLGKDAPNLSPAVIARLTAAWQADYDTWQKRELSARHAECMLVLIGATPEGKKNSSASRPGCARARRAGVNSSSTSSIVGSRSRRTSRSATARSASGRRSRRSFLALGTSGVGFTRPPTC